MKDCQTQLIDFFEILDLRSNAKIVIFSKRLNQHFTACACTTKGRSLGGHYLQINACVYIYIYTHTHMHACIHTYISTLPPLLSTHLGLLNRDFGEEA